MISRKKILTKGKAPPVEANFRQVEEEDDAWYQKEKLYRDHIQEVLAKSAQIDDEIWAKIIVFERNRRVAKAYARAPVLTVNGSNDGFDGFRIGLSGFDNPMRDPKTDECKRHIGNGAKIKMDDDGNVLIKRLSKGNIYIKSTSGQDEETSIGAEILKLPGCALEPGKPAKLFDMKKFQLNVNRELRRAYPDRRRLEFQCLSAIVFAKSEAELLECPIWVLIINVVAMDMLKSKLPPLQRVVDMTNRPGIPVPDEDPYSVAGNGSAFVAIRREKKEKPPKLPPRENLHGHSIPKPDYEDGEETRLMTFTTFKGKGNVTKKNIQDEDPYYCGLSARVPTFANKPKGKGPVVGDRYPAGHQQQPPPIPLTMHQHRMHQYHVYQRPMWHNRSIDSGTDESASESPYDRIYSRFPIPTRGYVPSRPRSAYIGEWE